MKMHYPKIAGNKIYDGKIHEIEPTKLNKINDYELYLLDYYDEKYQRECSTILEKSGKGFKKVSLLDYNLFLEMLTNGNLTITEHNLLDFENQQKEILIESLEPKKNFSEYKYLHKGKKSIILLIDKKLDILFEGIVLDGKTIFKFIEEYNIEWMVDYTDKIERAPQELVNAALEKYRLNEYQISEKSTDETEISYRGHDYLNKIIATKQVEEHLEKINKSR